jgi:hypothetical protein
MTYYCRQWLTKNRPVLSSERAPHKNKTLSNSNKYMVMSPSWGSTPRLTDWLWVKLCGGGVEYLHRSPTNSRRRRKGKSRIWHNKIWSRVPRDSDPRMTALVRPTAIVNDRRVLCHRERDINKPITDSNKNLVVRPRCVLYSKIDWPTNRRL